MTDSEVYIFFNILCECLRHETECKDCYIADKSPDGCCPCHKDKYNNSYKKLAFEIAKEHLEEIKSEPMKAYLKYFMKAGVS